MQIHRAIYPYHFSIPPMRNFPAHPVCLRKREDKKTLSPLPLAIYLFPVFFYLAIIDPFLIRLSISRRPNDGPASRNCTKHYPGSLPGVLSHVLSRDSSLCMYRRGYLRAPRRLLITISTTVFYQENGRRYLENKRQNVSA